MSNKNHPLAQPSQSSFDPTAPKVSAVQKIFGSQQHGLPSIVNCIVQILSLSFMKEQELPEFKLVNEDFLNELKESQMTAESTLGILAALVLGPASSLLYGSNNDLTALIGFLATNILIISMVCSVLHILTLNQCRSAHEIYFYVKALGANGTRLTGQIMVLGIILWIFGTIVYLWAQVARLAYFVVPIAILFTFAPVVTYFITHAVMVLNMTRHSFDTTEKKG
jgi:hypothetical protein